MAEADTCQVNVFLVAAVAAEEETKLQDPTHLVAAEAVAEEIQIKMGEIARLEAVEGDLLAPEAREAPALVPSS